jgi:hypothetical protein
MEVDTGAVRRLGAVASAGFLRSPWAAATAIVGNVGGRLYLAAVRGSEEGEREARRRGSGRREEAEGRGRQRNRVWDPFIRSKRNFSRPFADERSKMIELFWA